MHMAMMGMSTGSLRCEVGMAQGILFGMGGFSGSFSWLKILLRSPIMDLRCFKAMCCWCIGMVGKREVWCRTTAGPAESGCNVSLPKVCREAWSRKHCESRDGYQKRRES